jgi:hypothetical protein
VCCKVPWWGCRPDGTAGCLDIGYENFELTAMLARATFMTSVDMLELGDEEIEKETNR